MKDRIQQIMEQEGLTQKAFAAELGVSEGSLSGVFTGRTRPTQNHVMAIHRVFPKINVNWLMFGEGDMYEDGERERMKSLFDDMQEVKTQDEAQVVSTQSSRQVASNAPVEIRYVERPPRQITEIRIFFDDGTYETFSRNDKK